MLSMTTDYAAETECPEPYLARIAQAGFSHVHWCHHWNDDFMYSDGEIEQIAVWLRDFGLQLNDLHASSGREKAYGSLREYERRAGVELVRNRIHMAATLSSDVIILHLPERAEASDEVWRQVLKSLDDLEPYARAQGVRIAIENCSSFDPVERVLSQYSDDYLGLCYDSGHGNLDGEGPDRLEKLTHRLIAIHLSDNDGASDQHVLPFSGTVDWPRLARIIAESPYEKCVNLEVCIQNTGLRDEKQFLEQALQTGATLSQMMAKPSSDT